MATLSVSLFESTSRTAPIPSDIEFPADLLDHTEVADEADKLRQPLWSPATYKPGTTRRLAVNVDTVTALVLDFDHDADLERAALAWSANEFVIYTTAKHTPTDPRFRMVLPLERPATVAEHAALWNAAKQRSPEIDGACKDPCRIYFGPQHFPGIEPVALHWPGPRLQVPQVEGHRRHTPVAPSPGTSVFAGIEIPRPFSQVEDIESIKASCAFMRHAEADAETLSEPEWYAALSVLARCKGGDDLAHAWSAPHPKYTPAETSEKIDRAKQVGPATCSRIKTLTSACAGCMVCVTSPVQLGRAPVTERAIVVGGKAQPEQAGDVNTTPEPVGEDDVERLRAWVELAQHNALKASADLEMAKHALRRARSFATDIEVAAMVQARALAEQANTKAKDEVRRAERALRKVERKVDADAPPGADADAWSRLDVSPQDQRPRPTKGNIRVVLEVDPRYAADLSYNEFAAQLWLDGGPTTDEIITDIAIDLEYRYQLVVPTTLVGEVAFAVAKKRSFHPVREYMSGLAWDGVPRVGDLLNVGFNVKHGAGGDDYEWFADMARKFMVSCVARVFEPGCKVDTMLILTGDQYAGKSMGLRTLVSPPAAADSGGWFADSPVSIGEKDGAMQLRGNLIYELGEMDSFKRAEASRVKLWLSSQEDNVRLPYGKHVVKLKREGVICGTTNQPEFLNDPTGARRFLVAKVGIVDLDWIRTHRDQLWAEAVHLYQTGYQWWFTRDGIQKLNRLNEEFREHDFWEEIIRNAIIQRRLKEVTLLGVATDILHKEAADVSRMDRVRIAEVLRSLGCYQSRSGGGERSYLYSVPPELLSMQATGSTVTHQPATVLPFGKKEQP